MFGGNSNWRGPIWMPMQLMLIRGLVNQFAHLGKDFTVECPVGSGRQLNLLEVSEEIARRLSHLFIRNQDGHRPTHGLHPRWHDEHWRDHILFYEYFHGDTGAGVGASHQTGWTGLIAFLIHGFAAVEAEKVLEKGMAAVAEESAEVAREAAEPDGAEIADAVRDQMADKVVAQVVEAVEEHVAQVVQAETAQLQEKVEEIVMEKVAEAVQKKVEEVQQQSQGAAEDKKDVL
jgi:hypothetical protein